MAADERYKATWEKLQHENSAKQSRTLEVSGDGGDSGGMDGFDALRTDVDVLKKETAGLKAAVESLKGVVDGFKDGLRAMQWSLGIMLAVGLAALGWMVSIGNSRISEMNARLDRFLEWQAEAASAANSRFDRLLEQRSGQAAAPIIIQVPSVQQPAQPGPPPG